MKPGTLLPPTVWVSAVTREAPAWFSAFYRQAVGHQMTYERPIKVPGSRRGGGVGRIVVSSNLSAVTARAWSDISRMLGLSAATIGALGILVYFVVERALRPTRDVVSGLIRLATGDLKCRLPPFRLAELQRISNVFNDLATTLECVHLRACRPRATSGGSPGAGKASPRMGASRRTGSKRQCHECDGSFDQGHRLD